MPEYVFLFELPRFVLSGPLVLMALFSGIFLIGGVLMLIGAKQAVTEALIQRNEQTAHDIGSPLTALETGLRLTKEIPEEARALFRHATTRIRDITNSLMSHNLPSIRHQDTLKANVDLFVENNAGLSIELVPTLIDSLVTEKRTQFREKGEIEISFDQGSSSYGLFAKIQRAEFLRALSNLINNSVEAIHGRGRIAITILSLESKLVVQISDSGRGIPPHILPKLMDRGQSFGKANGRGLGLYHARKTLEACGGKLAIQSEEGKGTVVSLTVPQADPPGWFLPEILVPALSHVVVLDDDASIHQVWNARFNQLSTHEERIRLVSFSTSAQLRAWVEKNRNVNVMYLVDYELVGDSTGIDVIRSLGIERSSIVVTSRYSDPEVLQQCESLKLPLLPKSSAPLVPMRIIESATFVADGVLIDDDRAIRYVWRTAAKQAGRRLKVFRSARTFFAVANKIPKSVPIYIDSKLGEGEKGEEVAKEIYALGFKDIKLTTSIPSSRFSAMPWLKEVVGKQPPWEVQHGVG